MGTACYSRQCHFLNTWRPGFHAFTGPTLIGPPSHAFTGPTLNFCPDYLVLLIWEHETAQVKRLVFRNMAGNYRFAMDQKDMVRILTTTVQSFIQDRLISKEQRTQHKEQCAERLAAEDESMDKDREVRYSDQAVLANLDWGMDALEEAINTSNMETKLARLDYAEKMLQVCAMLNSSQKTAGVPNFYLSAWAHLNLSYLWMLRNNIHNSVLHVLEMFIIDPFFARIDFAPELWKDMFLPHMGSVVGWYSEARHRLVMETIPDSADLSFTADIDQFFNESLVFSMRPDQVEKLQNLEQLYGESLDENTRLYAKYYKDCMNSDSTPTKKVIPMMPIVEPPLTPLHELSRAIPDYVKFGPILPKSAGFSPVLRNKNSPRDHHGKTRTDDTSSTSHNMLESDLWDPQEGVNDENEEDSGYEPVDAYTVQEDKNHKLVPLSSMRMIEEKQIAQQVYPSKPNSRVHSPSIFSPIDSPHKILSPRTLSAKVPSPKLAMHGRKEHTSALRLLSSRAMDSPTSTSLPTSPHMNNDYSISSAGSDAEALEHPRSHRTRHSPTVSNMSYDNVNTQTLENSSPKGSDEGNQSCVLLPLSEKLTPSRPPKDFVCPITSQIINDPVTLETGQTYERKAIEEWLNRGNTTCPITRQPLCTNALPKTNYVLKRLITSWKEQYPELAQEFSFSETPKHSLSSSSTPSRTPDFPRPRITVNSVNLNNKRFSRAVVATSPTSVISQAAIETLINGLKPHVSCLCTSEDLKECEDAVQSVARIWKESKGDPGIHSYLSKPTIVNGFVEVLSASLDRQVLRTTVYILSELIFAEESVGEILTSVDSDFECLASLLKNGLAEAAVLIYQLRPALAQLSDDFIPALVQIILNKADELDSLQLLMEPKYAAIAIIEQILMGGNQNSRTLNALRIIEANGVPALIKCLDKIEGRRSIVYILLYCIYADKSCRTLIASRIEMSPVLELFHAGNDSVKGICIDFVSEIVQLDRRIFCNQILQTIKDEGAFSTMHAFLVYLQMAPMEQQPAIASLLLQLDLLVEPLKMSIYREEAIDALIEALRRKDFPNYQFMALDALLSLSGRLTASGKSYTEAWLLKIAGFDQPYYALMKTERRKNTNENELMGTLDEEEKATSSWEKRIAFVLCNHEKGSIFKALEEGLRSNSLEMAKSCLIIATWLTHRLHHLPDTGVRSAARKALLDQFINVLQSSKNLEEKILATLALRTFISDPGALQELGAYARCIYKNLRKLKRSSAMVSDILKALMNFPSVNAAELWSYSDVVEINTSQNGEVLSLLYLKGRILSSHSDGTIKVWDTGKRALRLVQEAREHTKAVTRLCISTSGDKLYSGSLDRTIRVWSIRPEEIHCVQVHDVKEPVYELSVNANAACFVSQGTGVKVYNWSGAPKQTSLNKNVKCLAMTGDKLYCGLTGYSIQEVDLSKFTSNAFYSGTRKLLAKQTIHSLHIHNGLLFAGGSSVDGTAGKVFSLSTKAVGGSFTTGLDIQHIAASNDLIFTATKCGMIEVWLKERVTRLGSIRVGSGHAKITSLVSDLDGGLLYAGSSDGKIQVWAMD